MKGFEIWIYRGLIALLLGIIWWVIRRWAVQISDKFDQIIEAMNKMAKVNTNQEVRIGVLEKRTDDHAKRLRNIEIGERSGQNK